MPSDRLKIRETPENHCIQIEKQEIAQDIRPKELQFRPVSRPILPHRNFVYRRMPDLRIGQAPEP
jgi:hypothetical protein